MKRILTMNNTMYASAGIFLIYHIHSLFQMEMIYVPIDGNRETIAFLFGMVFLLVFLVVSIYLLPTLLVMEGYRVEMYRGDGYRKDKTPLIDSYELYGVGLGLDGVVFDYYHPILESIDQPLFTIHPLLKYVIEEG